MAEAIFDHEGLEVYQVARQLKHEIHELIAPIPRGNADLIDQLKRAARSITSNIAEGSGRWTVPDKVHCYHIARGSATECAALLDECVDCALLTNHQIKVAMTTLNRVVAMLVRMILSLEERGSMR